MLGLLLTLAIVPQGSNQARLHPADAMVMVEMPDVTKMVAAYEKAPMISMIRDPEVRKTFFGVLEGGGVDIHESTADALRSMGMPEAFANDPLAGVRHYLDGIGAASFSFSLDREGFSDFGSLAVRMEKIHAQILALDVAIRAHADQTDPASPPKTLDELKLEPGATIDPWGHPYDYTVQVGGDYLLRSLGADGKPGGTGENEDVTAAQAEGFGEGFVALLGFQAVVEFKNQPALEELRGMLSALFEKSEAKPIRSGPFQMAGVQGELQSWGAPGDEMPGVELWMMRVQNMLVIGGGRSTPEGFAARLADPNMKTAAEKFYAGLAKDFGAPTGATIIQGSLHLADYQAALEELMTSQNGDQEILDALQTMFPDASLRMQLVGERFVTEMTTQYVNPTGMTAVALKMAPFARDLLAAVPEDAIGVYVAGLDAPMMWNAFKQEVKKAEEVGQAAEEQIAEVEKKYSFSIEQDLVGSLGKGMMLYLLPLKGVVSIPGMALVVDVKDPVALQRGIEGLMALLKDEAGEFVKVRYKPYQDAPLWTFNVSPDEEGGEMNPLMNQFSPSIAIVKNRLFVTLNAFQIKKEIKRAIAGGEAVHVIATPGNLPPESATSFGYMDWAALLNGLYDGGRGLLNMMGSGGPVPVDATTLPEPSVFTRFYKPTTYYTRTIPNGIYMRNESSFGPETWLSLIGLGVGAAWMSESSSGLQIVEELEEVPSADGVPGTPPKSSAETTVTRETMRQVATAIAVYQMDTGKYPAALERLLEPTKNYPAGFLKQRELPRDGWGRSFGYTQNEGGAGYRLWSFGADGEDGQGTGDDIVSP